MKAILPLLTILLLLSGCSKDDDKPEQKYVDFAGTYSCKNFIHSEYITDEWPTSADWVMTGSNLSGQYVFTQWKEFTFSGVEIPNWINSAYTSYTLLEEKGDNIIEVYSKVYDKYIKLYYKAITPDSLLIKASEKMGSQTHIFIRIK